MARLLAAVDTGLQCTKCQRIRKRYPKRIFEGGKYFPQLNKGSLCYEKKAVNAATSVLTSHPSSNFQRMRLCNSKAANIASYLPLVPQFG